MRLRSGTSVISSCSSTTMIVSAEGIATSTASYRASAATHSVMMRWSSNGRTASWNSTQQSSSPSALSAVRAVCVVSLRVLPPASTVLILLYGAASRRASSTWAPFISRTMSSISGASWKMSRVCSRMVLPATLSSCLGMFRPTREPVPPARTTATVRKGVDIGGGKPSGGVSAPASAPSR